MEREYIEDHNVISHMKKMGKYRKVIKKIDELGNDDYSCDVRMNIITDSYGIKLIIKPKREGSHVYMIKASVIKYRKHGRLHYYNLYFFKKKNGPLYRRVNNI